MYPDSDVIGRMDRISATVFVAAAVVIMTFATLLSAPVLPPEVATGTPLYATMEAPHGTAVSGLVMTRDPTPSDHILGPDDLRGPTPQVAFGVYEGRPVLVLKASQAALSVASKEYDNDTTHYGVPDADGEIVYLAYDTRSTFLGCGVAWMPELGATPSISDRDQDGVPDGRAMDVCHQGQWDLYGLAYPAPYTSAPRPLDTFHLDLRTLDGRSAFVILDRIEWAAPFVPA